MNDLEQYFRQNKGRQMYKCVHYFDIYEKYFSRYREKEVVILEIGVSHGGSLQMWKHYFGSKAKIFGIDIDPNCKQFEEEQIKIFTGSVTDKMFMKSVINKIPAIDILIDDGGHTMKQQIHAFEILFDHVKTNGIYLCEDLHTSYWLKYGGGHKRRGTFIEYSKNFIDRINAHYSEQSSLKPNKFTTAVSGLHFYNGIMVIEKGSVNDFHAEKTGEPSDIILNGEVRKPKFIHKIADPVLRIINTVLRFFRLPGIVWR